MTTYATFSYYQSTYLGTAIAEADFPRLALRASAQIDRVTFNRAAAIITADTDATTVAAIKNATCEVAEEIQWQESAANVDGVTSESQGQYSVSYGANSNRSKSNQSEIETAAHLWLENTFLMFGGFNTGEYGGLSDDT